MFQLVLLMLCGLFCVVAAAQPEGRYYLDAETSVVVAASDGGLLLTLSDHEPCRMVELSPGRYALPELQAELRAGSRRGGDQIVLRRYGMEVAGRRTPPRAPRSGPRSGRARQEAIRRQTPVWMMRYNVPGVAVALIADRRIVWHGEFGVRAATGQEPITTESVFEACSMSKPVFAYAALRLVEQGRLDLDRPLDDYLAAPYLPAQPEAARITARMVLNHTTGLPNWRPGGWRRGAPPALIALPGEKFTYSGEGMTYLQTVVERICGKSIEDFMQEALLVPLGMERSSYAWRESYEPSYAMGHNQRGELKNFAHYHHPNTAFSLYTTPVEYARFLLAMMEKRPRRAHLLSRETVEQMLSAESAVGEHVSYGLGWRLYDGPEGRYAFHGGANGAGFRCFCRFDPERGDGAVVMTNSDAGVEVHSRVMQLIYP